MIDLVINNNQAREDRFKTDFPLFYHIISTTEYPSNFTFQQKLYHFLNNDSDLKLGICGCEGCENRTGFISVRKGYRKFCSRACSNRDSDRISHFRTLMENKSDDEKESMVRKSRETWSLKTKDELMEIHNKIFRGKDQSYISEKRKSTMKGRYGDEVYFRTDDFKQKRKSTYLDRYDSSTYQNVEKMRETWSSKSPDEISDIIQRRRETCLDLYGVDNYSKTDMFRNLDRTMDESEKMEIQRKIHQTRKRNKSFRTSNPEIQFTKYLQEHGIDFISQYRSELYPYNCDFYLPDYDLYIEIQGHWGHGKYPYNPDDENDKKILDVWKSRNTPYYRHSIQTWTVNDPKKRKTASENKLNYLEIFSNDIGVIIERFETYLEIRKENGA